MTLSATHACPMPTDRTSSTRLASGSRPTVWARLNRWTALTRQRADLAKLDSTALRDIGVTAEDARREALRPFWDAPQHWIK